MRRLLTGSLLALTACGPADLRLLELPTAGVLGAEVTSASRSSSGAVFATVFNGPAVRLRAGAGAWEPLPSTLRQVSVPQGDGMVYAEGGGATWQVVGDELVAVSTPAGATWLATLTDGSRWFVGPGNELTSSAAGSSTFTARGTALFGEGGLGTLRDGARMVKWNRQQGLLQRDLATGATTTLLPCTHPSLRGCAMFPDFVPGRRGELFFVNSNDTTSSQVELWRLDPQATEPVKLAGPTLPGLALRTDDDQFNRYRPGQALLYVDTRDRVWLAFRWGANEPADVSYLYLWAGSGDWQLVFDDLPSNTGLGADGETPLVLNLRSGAGFHVSRLVP